MSDKTPRRVGQLWRSSGIPIVVMLTKRASDDPLLGEAWDVVNIVVPIGHSPVIRATFTSTHGWQLIADVTL